MAVEKKVQIKESHETEHETHHASNDARYEEENEECIPPKRAITQQLCSQNDVELNENLEHTDITEGVDQKSTNGDLCDKNTTQTSIDIDIPQVTVDTNDGKEENDENENDGKEGNDENKNDGVERENDENKNDGKEENDEKLEADNGKADDDDDESQSVVMGTTKSVTFSIHHNLDDVDEEIARVTLNKASEDQMSNFDVEVDDYGRAHTTNTPVTVITEYQEDGRKSTENRRQDIYDHAMSVMRNRSSLTHYTQSQTTIKSHLTSATSSRTTIGEANGLPIYPLPSIIDKIHKPAFAKITNCSFYVVQKRVHPVPPIKAWKGYDTNVYFEPMICKKLDLTSTNDPPKTYPQNMVQPKSPTKSSQPSDEGSIELPEINQSNIRPTEKTNKSTSVKSVRIAHSAASARTGAKSRVKSRASTSVSRPLTSGSRPLAVLDKLSVLNNIDSNIREDIKWIDGLESTGTLQEGEPLRRTGSTTHIYKRNAGNRHYKMRICRGLVSHQLAGQNLAQSLDGVSGGRLVDSPSKFEYLEREYQGESHFLSNPHGMFTSPVPVGSSVSPSPLPSVHQRQTSPNYTRASYPPPRKSHSKRQPLGSGK